MKDTMKFVLASIVGAVVAAVVAITVTTVMQPCPAPVAQPLSQRTPAAMAQVPASSYIVREGANLKIRPFDWSTLQGQTYQWYDLQAMNDWVNNGGAMPTATPRPVVNADGTPNLPQTPDLPTTTATGKDENGNGLYYTFSATVSDTVDHPFLFPPSEPSSPWYDTWDYCSTTECHIFDTMTRLITSVDTMSVAVTVPVDANLNLDEVNGATREFPLTLREEDASPTYQQQVDYIVYLTRQNGNQLTAPDEALLRNLIPSHNRRERLMAEIMAIVRDNFSQDSANLQAALNQAVADPSIKTIQLEAGKFLAAREVVAKNFSGTLRGAGKDRTTIETVSGSFLSTPEPLLGEGPREYAMDVVLLFDGGNATVSDLTMAMKGRGHSNGFHGANQNLWSQAIHFTAKHAGSYDDQTPDPVSGTVEKVKFTHDALPDDQGGWGGKNAFHDVMIAGQFNSLWSRYGQNTMKTNWVTGDFRVTDCESDAVAEGMTTVYSMKDSTLVFENNIVSSESIVGSSAVMIDDMSNSTVTIRHNTVRNSNLITNYDGDFAMWGYSVLGGLGKEWFGKPSTVIVSNNIISPKGSGPLDAIDIFGLGTTLGLPSTAWVITNNEFILNDNPGEEWVWGIFMDGESNSVISNNKFSGYGGCGVLLTNWYGGGASRGSTIAKNDFTGLDAVGWCQDVYLGGGTFDTTVFKNGKDMMWWDDSGLCSDTNSWCVSDSDCGGSTCVLTNTIVDSKRSATDKTALTDAIKKAKMCQRGMKSGRMLGDQLELCGVQR